MKSKETPAHRRSRDRSSEQAALPENVTGFPSWEPAVHWIAALLLLVVVAFQPIGGDDLWWQLSRGCIVMSGSITPSKTLLTMETHADSDWLGGLPAYVLYQTLGGHAWMLTRSLIFGVCILGLLAPRRNSADAELVDPKGRRQWRLARPAVWCVVTAFAVASSDWVNITPRMFDCVAIALLASLRYRTIQVIGLPEHTGSASSKPGGWKWINVALVAFILFTLWSNLSLGIFSGLIAWLTSGSLLDRTRSRSSLSSWTIWGKDWMVAGSMLVGGMMNPRGALAWADSLSTLVPFWQNPASVLIGTPWQPLSHEWANSTSLLFLLLTAFWLGYQLRAPRRLPRNWVCFLWFQFLAWSSSQNVALASTWMAADVLLHCHANGRWLVPRIGQPGRQPLAVLSGPLFVAIALPISNLTTTMGWGIDASLDNRLLRITLESTRPYGTALASDTRSGGMLAWNILQQSGQAAFGRLSSSNRPPLRVQDVPIRAVITGRLRRHQRLINDLREERLMSYRLTDGSEAGYWVPLENRQTTLIVVSQTQTDLIRALQPSIWKPLSLDSPVIPFAQAGDAAYAQRMIEILNNREVIEYQAWNFDFPKSTGSIFDRDLWGLRVRLANPEQALQQADVFLAMDLPYASLRVLFVAEQSFPDSNPIRCLIVRCQAELAAKERIGAGRPSRFRQLAAFGSPMKDFCDASVSRSGQINDLTSMSWVQPQRDSVPNAPVADDDTVQTDVDRELQLRVRNYLRHGPAELIVLEDFESRDDPSDSPLMYAGLCGAIEAGERLVADRYLRWFEDHPVAPVLKRLVQIRTEELYPGSADR